MRFLTRMLAALFALEACTPAPRAEVRDEDRERVSLPHLASGICDGRQIETSGSVQSAAIWEGDRERCLEAGMDGYIAKPIAPGQLHTVVHGVTSAAALV